MNINKGHNRKLLEQCQSLKEYAEYVARVRKYTARMGLDEAVHRAVKECIEEGILEEFLRRNRAEVEAVSIFEYNKEEEERKLREAEYEGGWQAGQEAGLQKGRETILQMSREFHLEEDAVIEFLCRKLDVDEATARKILKES